MNPPTREFVVYYQTEGSNTDQRNIPFTTQCAMDNAILNLCRKEKVLAIYELELSFTSKFEPKENIMVFTPKVLSSTKRTYEYKGWMKRGNGEFTRIMVNDRKNISFNLFYESNAEALISYNELIKSFDPMHVEMI